MNWPRLILGAICYAQTAFLYWQGLDTTIMATTANILICLAITEMYET